MPRIVSIWLPDWPVRRILRARPELSAEGAPVVLAAPGPGGPRLTAVDAAAAALGLAPGLALADARARAARPLAVAAAEPEADAAALRRLALWATRYAPLVAADGDGLLLDVTGAEHLLGGEAALLADLVARLGGFGLPARAACAPTPGLAWALARYGAEPVAHVPAGGEAEALADLPVAALRLPPETPAALRRLGFRRVQSLLDAARAPLARRFGTALVLRLDQALGRRPEPLDPVRPPATYAAVRRLLEPVRRREAVVAHARRLMAELAPALEAADVGARRLRLSLYRVDGRVDALAFGLAEPTRSPDHLVRLLGLRLDRDRLDAGFGFETLRLEAVAVAPMTARRAALGAPKDLAPLRDALAQRTGRRPVRLLPAASHLPERSVAEAGVGAEGDAPADWTPPAPGARPLLLLDEAEPVDVVALVPDGPPQRFRWRGRLHHVAHAQGPERIAPEWWRAPAGRTRDYYVVEDAAARRLWLYRDGLYGAPPPAFAPRWFVHGLFA
jgi:protein ImuB